MPIYLYIYQIGKEVFLLFLVYLVLQNQTNSFSFEMRVSENQKKRSLNPSVKAKEFFAFDLRKHHEQTNPLQGVSLLLCQLRHYQYNSINLIFSHFRQCLYCQNNFIGLILFRYFSLEKVVSISNLKSYKKFWKWCLKLARLTNFSISYYIK